MLKKSIFFVAILSLVFLSACSLKKEKELTLDEAKVKAQQFINENFMDASSTIEVSDIKEDEQTGLYKFSIDLGDGELVDSYISKDGKFLFPQAYNISEVEQALSGEATTTDSAVTASTTEPTDNSSFNESASFESKEKVAIYFFWGDGCPHCANQKTAMADWTNKFSGIEIKTYETWKNEDNRATLEKLAAAYGTSVEGVPMTFIGDKYWVGYSDSMKTEMEAKIQECLKNTCENPGSRLK